MPAGPPKKYDPSYHPRIAKLFCTNHGLTDEELAKIFNIAVSTLYVWKKEYPELSEAVKKGGEDFDNANVKKTLLRRALGYDFEERTEEYEITKAGLKLMIKEKVVKKQMAPDVMAIMYWLNNRDKLNWRHKQTIEHEGGVTMLAPERIDKK